MKRVALGLALVTVALGAWVLDRPSAVRAVGPSDAGTVRFVRDFGASFEPFVRTSRHARFFNEHYWRAFAYSPYFDDRLSWFPDAWVYQDLQAIYPGSDWARQHPEWILRDAAGNLLYVPYACEGGTCPQYAADIGDPAFRTAWLAQTAEKLSKGYRGLYIDDVNLTPHVGDGTGHIVMPVDDRTGVTMTAADWSRYMAEFVEAVRERFPSTEIVHNSLWWLGDSDPYIRRQQAAADYINLERGVNDAGITGGDGPTSLHALLDQIDRLHEAGKGVVYESYTDTEAGREYALAAYLLANDGSDALSTDVGGTPEDWWPGFDVRLGAPLNDRHEWRGLMRRDFEGGVVLLNEPDAPVRSEPVDDDLVGIDGDPVRRVTLAGGQGIVLTWR
jgi:hypothetical protein